MNKKALMLCVLLAAAAAAQSKQVEAAIRANAAEFEKAVAAKDIDKIAAFYAEDAVFQSHNQPAVTGAPAIRAMFQGMLSAGVGDLKLEVLAVESSGNLAYERGRYSFNSPGGKDEGKYLVVWRKEKKGGWKIAVDTIATDLPPVSPPPPPTASLYKRLGGYDAIDAVVGDFLGRLATDKQLSRFFAGVSRDSVTRIHQQAVELICNAAGGPCRYIGRSMKASHAGLGITSSDWDRMAQHLTATLDKFKVPAKEKGEVLAALSGLRADIVEK
jgi:hemoglobin